MSEIIFGIHAVQALLERDPQLNYDPLSFQRGDQGLQATIVAAFEDKDLLETLWVAD
jgi:hypothetical protein